MDLIIAAGIAVIVAIAAALIAVFTKKPKKRILLYATAGLVTGAAAGYALAPFVISFL